MPKGATTGEEGRWVLWLLLLLLLLLLSERAYGSSGSALHYKPR